MAGGYPEAKTDWEFDEGPPGKSASVGVALRPPQTQLFRFRPTPANAREHVRDLLLDSEVVDTAKNMI